MPRFAVLAAGLTAAALLLTVASAAIPHRVASGSASTTTNTDDYSKLRAHFVTSVQRRNRSRPSAAAESGSRWPSTLADATQAAVLHGKNVKARRAARASPDSKSSAHMRSAGFLGQRIQKSRSAAKMRKAFEKTAPGVVQTAEALRRKGITMTSTLTDTFVGYDTDARRARLQLSPLQGTDDQKDKCKRLGWSLVSLYLDMATGEEIKYNEGCSEDDLWMSGLGFEDDSGAEVCWKIKRRGDMDIDWSSSNPFYTGACWTTAQWGDYCSATSSAKCTLNGTKGTGTATSGTKSWYTGAATTGGPGELPVHTCAS